MKIISAEEARLISRQGVSLDDLKKNALIHIDSAIKEAAKVHKYSIEFPVDFRVSSLIVKVLTEAGFRVSGFDKLFIKWDDREAPKGSNGVA